MRAEITLCQKTQLQEIPEKILTELNVYNTWLDKDTYMCISLSLSIYICTYISMCEQIDRYVDRWQIDAGMLLSRKKRRNMAIAITWMDLENTLLSKISKTKKSQEPYDSLTCAIQNWKQQIKMTNKTHRHRQQHGCHQSKGR